MINQELSGAESKMSKAVEVTREEFAAIRAGRAHPSMFAKLTAEYYGTPTPLQQLASFTQPEARIILIAPYDMGAMSAIEKSIRDSDLGINPTNDGKVLRCVFPELTEERRKEYIKVAKTKAEEGRVSVRNIRATPSRRWSSSRRTARSARTTSPARRRSSTRRRRSSPTRSTRCSSTRKPSSSRSEPMTETTAAAPSEPPQKDHGRAGRDLRAAVASAVVAVRIWGWVPGVPRRPSRLDVRGAAFLTGGMGMVLVALTLVGQHHVFPWAIITALVGLTLLTAYGVTSRGRTAAMIPLSVLVESRFLRSTAAAFGQMFCLGTVLVALPLVFTGPLGMSAGAAGALFFVLPAVMAVSAPLSSTLSRRLGPRRALRMGLTIIVSGAAVTGVVAGLDQHTVVAVGLILLMIILGFGMALVQTPAAAGATSSPAGAYGAAVGLFNMMRFSGSAAAAAWVALAYPIGSMLLLFGLVAGIAVLALAASFAGPDPAPMTVRPLSQTSGRG